MNRQSIRFGLSATTTNSVDGNVSSDEAMKVGFSPVLSSGLLLYCKVKRIEESRSSFEPSSVLLNVKAREVISAQITDDNLSIGVRIMALLHFEFYYLRVHYSLLAFHKIDAIFYKSCLITEHLTLIEILSDLD